MIETGDIRQAASLLGKMSAAKRKLDPVKYSQQQSAAARKPRPNAKGKPKRRKKSTDTGCIETDNQL